MDGDFSRLCMEEIKELMKMNKEVNSWEKFPAEEPKRDLILTRVIETIEFLEAVIAAQAIRSDVFEVEKKTWTCLAEMVLEHLPKMQVVVEELKRK
jgi:hypothetical protein